jgi:hypothetical protein
MLIILLLIIPTVVLSKTYYCPQKPIDFEIGKTYDKYWYAWKEHEERTWLNQLYYKLFPAKYHFQSWTGFSSGKLGSGKRDNNYYIACCEIQNQEGKRICLYRLIQENNCEAIRNRPAREKFICQSNGASQHKQG